MRVKFKILNPKHQTVVAVARFVAATFIFFCAQNSFALTGEEIIRRVDANMTYGTSRFESRMVINVDGELRTKNMVSYSRGRDTSYSEFTYPPRDKGVKYLKIENNMWMYLPSVDKVIKISGSMLRQSMMGSDFSYEDAMESNRLLDKYSARLVRSETVPVTFRAAGDPVTRQRDCYVVELEAKVKDVTYYKRLTWIDKELLVPVREDLFAMSGKLLKTMTLGDVRSFGSRNFPTYMKMVNHLRKNSFTEMHIEKISFDSYVPDSVFSQSALTK